VDKLNGLGFGGTTANPVAQVAEQRTLETGGAVLAPRRGTVPGSHVLRVGLQTALTPP
jgi:hypothetical protein